MADYKKIQILLILILPLMTGSLAAAEAAPQPKETCRVMPGEKVKLKFFADFQGKRYFFCCRSCVRKFKKNPAKYAG